MKRAIVLTTAILAILSMGAGPVWYEPETYTGEAIERAISAAYKDIRGKVFLPGGTYKLTRTLRLNGIGPLTVEGNATGIPFPEWNHVGTVRLEWWGPKDEPMIRLAGVGMHFKNMMIDGRGVASHGVLLVNSPRGGTGMNRFEDVVFQNHSVACFQAGESNANPNCSDTFFDRVWMMRAPAGFRSVNDQSVNNHFVGCQLSHLERGLDIERGGAVTFTNGAIAAIDTVLKLRVGGHNTGAINFGPARLERGGYKRKYMTVVDARFAEKPEGFVDSGQIRLESVRMADGGMPDVADDMETPILRIGPGVQVTAENCLFEAAGDRGQWPLARIESGNTTGASLRSVDTLWRGPIESIITTGENAFVEVLNPADFKGLRGPTLRRGTP